MQQYQPQPASVHTAWVTTAFQIDGVHIERNLGIVRGIIVRSSIVGALGAGVQQLFGGNISLYTELVRTRSGSCSSKLRLSARTA